MTTQEQAERRAAFYADLRSGNFQQLRKAMRDREIQPDRSIVVKHCCLGVAQERFEADETVEHDTYTEALGCEFYFRDYNADGDPIELLMLSEGASTYYGFKDLNPDLPGTAVLIDGEVLPSTYSASEWNDSEKKSFPEIADMFEDAYPAVADV